MANLQFCPHHNVCAMLQKPKESTGFHEIIDFLKQSSIKHALTVNPTIYVAHIKGFWGTASVTEHNGVQAIKAKIENQEVVITEGSIRLHLELNDESGITSLPLQTLFETFQRMGYEGSLQSTCFLKSLVSSQWRFLIHTLQQCLSQKRTGWSEFGSTLATAIVCLTTNQQFNFSRMIFNGLLWNLANSEKKFLMYPRFLQHILNREMHNLTPSNEIFIVASHGKKLFANMRRDGKNFSGTVTPLFSTMGGVTINAGEGVETQSMPHPTPEDTQVPPPQSFFESPILPVEPLPHHFVRRKHKKVPTTLVVSSPTPNSPPQEQSSMEYIQRENIEHSPTLKGVVTKEKGDHVTRAHPTASTHSVEQDRVNIIKTRLTATSNEDASMEVSSSEGPRCQETTGGEDVHARHGTSPKYPSNDPHIVGTPQGDGEDSLKIKELMETCTLLNSLVDAQGKEIAKLKRVVHKMRKYQKNHQFQMKRKDQKLKRMKKVGTSQVVSSSSSSSSSSPKDAPTKGEKDVVHIEENVMDEIVDSIVEEGMEDVEKVIAKVIESVAESEQPKAIQPSKPKEKGFEISVKKTVEEVINEDIPTNQDKRPKGIISTKQGPKVVILEEVAGQEDKGKGMLIEKEKPAKSSASQIEKDAELARLVVEEERMEFEKNEMKKLKEEEYRLRMKGAQLKKKAAEDRKKFSSFLKTVGYEGRQLGPMKLINLAELYEQEKKMLEEKLMKAKIENERLVKESLERGAHVVKVGKEDSSKVVGIKRKKQVAKKNPSQVKRQKSSEPQSQKHESKDVSHFIVPSKAIHVDPIQMVVPVKDWEYVDNNFDHAYFIRRADLSWKKFGSFHGIVRELNREDIEMIYKIGLKKMENKKLDNVGMIVAMEWLEGMFKPKAKSSARMPQAVRKWEHFANSGVYCITRMDTSFEYYLVEKKYDHGLFTLKMMMDKKLNANSNSREAINLIWKIIAQIKEEEEKGK